MKMPRAILYRIRSAEDWKKKKGDVNKFGAVIENPFVGSDGLCYTTTHCPICGLPMTISKFGFSRFKGCESCRAGHKARDRSEDSVKGELEKTLDPVNLWKRLCRNRQSDEHNMMLEEIATQRN
jgi:hypothetical protein